MKMRLIAVLAAALLASACASMGGAAGSPAASADSGQLLSIDHYVRVKSAAPAMAGQAAQVYVRERVVSRNIQRGSSGVVLFVHGAGTPAEVAFDVPYSDYSWMAYLANAGFDVFSMDMEGYGRSTRPTVMNDPCNLARAQQALFVPSLIAAPCAQSFQGVATTIASDWNDIGAVVDYVRGLRHVDKINLAGWSQGGPRAGGYAAQHPEQVQRLVLLAPAYARTGPDSAPGAPAARADAVVFNTQSQKEFDANWDRQVGCSDQYDKDVSKAIWADMVASDPVGSTWGAGVRRAPTVPSWGFNKNVVSKNQTPTLMVAGVHDKQVNPASVRAYYEDLASPEKVFVDLACSSHNAMWEKNHLLLFQASLEWFQQGTVDGKKTGMLKLGYETDKKTWTKRMLINILLLAAAFLAPPVKSVRLYIFDCGVIKGLGVDNFGFKAGEVPPRDFFVPCYLVAHPKGTLMWDVGVVPDSAFKGGAGPVTEGISTVTRPLLPQLASLGYTPADITYLSMSHYHSDHTANANAFAGSTWLVRLAERDTMFAPPAPGAIIQAASFSQLKTAKTRILNDDDYDVFGDGTVVIKSAPGHTPGHTVLFLKLKKFGPLLVAGDLYHYPEEQTMNRFPSFEFDKAQSAKSRADIDAFLKKTKAVMWISHDMATNMKLKKAPEYYE